MIWLWAANIEQRPSDGLAKIRSTSKCQFDLTELSAGCVCRTYNISVNTLRSGRRCSSVGPMPRSYYRTALELGHSMCSSVGPTPCSYYMTALELGHSMCTISRPRADGYALGQRFTCKLVGSTPTHHLR